MRPHHLQVCSKVASYLEQGQRLENLSWRLWHLQNIMVESDNAKSKREFKKLSKTMGDKLDKEKGRYVNHNFLARFFYSIKIFFHYLPLTHTLIATCARCQYARPSSLV